MKIIRGDQEYELTEIELYRAYEEQKFLFARQDIEDNMHRYLSEHDYNNLKCNVEFVNSAVNEYIDAVEDKDLRTSDALKHAIIINKDKYV